MFWNHLSTAPAPFGELAWDHGRRQLAADGKEPAGQEIARAVDSLLRRAHQGPGERGRPVRKPGAKDRRVAARTKATAQPAWPRPEPLDAPAGSSEPAETPGEPPDDRLADVVPLAVFDAREEAGKWW